ncbi:unnamed protein product [Rotaria sp. Silwood1]|nr:unnamed protein product [Rotaria sp. Silwood1]
MSIFLTFNLYNPNVNLFIYCSLLVEYLPSIGCLIPRVSFQPLKLVQRYTNVELIYIIIYLFLILCYIYIEIRLIIEHRLSYIKQIWCYINWTIIIFSWIGVGFHFMRQAELKRLGKLFKFSHGYYSINLQLHLLRFNRRFTLLWLTLQKAKGSLIGIMFTAFTSLFYLLFNVHLYEFSTLFITAQRCF